MTDFDLNKILVAFSGRFFGLDAIRSSAANPAGDGSFRGATGPVHAITRFYVAVLLAVSLGACAGTSPAVSPLHKRSIATQHAALRAQLDWNRKCEIMVLASKEPEKASHLASRCRKR